MDNTATAITTATATATSTTIWPTNSTPNLTATLGGFYDFRQAGWPAQNFWLLLRRPKVFEKVIKRSSLMEAAPDLDSTAVAAAAADFQRALQRLVIARKAPQTGRHSPLSTDDDHDSGRTKTDPLAADDGRKTATQYVLAILLYASPSFYDSPLARSQTGGRSTGLLGRAYRLPVVQCAPADNNNVHMLCAPPLAGFRAGSRARIESEIEAETETEMESRQSEQSKPPSEGLARICTGQNVAVAGETIKLLPSSSSPSRSV